MNRGTTADDDRELRGRLQDLQSARAELPPHSAHRWREELDRQIDEVRRRLAARSGPRD